MQVDVLIVGQGICGTLLGWWLDQAGLSYVILDEKRPDSASRVAAGVINPVTGRRMVRTWMIDDLLPFAEAVYQQIGRELNLPVIAQANTLDFFPTPQMRHAYSQRYEEGHQYLSPVSDHQKWISFFNYEFGWGEISPCYLVDLRKLLEAWRTRLMDRGRLAEERFIFNDLVWREDEIQYHDFRGRHLIFCDGIGSCDNPLFQALPFAPNKGEVLLLEIKDLPGTQIFKKGISLIPLSDGYFWAGSSYEWEFQDNNPTEAFRNRMTRLLMEWLKIPCKVVDHLSSIRPATVERRPFVGFHPVHQNIGILNGMGTKGCSLAPYFSKQLVDLISRKTTILPDADINRFSRILNRTSFER